MTSISFYSEAISFVLMHSMISNIHSYNMPGLAEIGHCLLVEHMRKSNRSGVKIFQNGKDWNYDSQTNSIKFLAFN